MREQHPDGRRMRTNKHGRWDSWLGCFGGVSGTGRSVAGERIFSPGGSRTISDPTPHAWVIEFFASNKIAANSFVLV